MTTHHVPLANKHKHGKQQQQQQKKQVKASPLSPSSRTQDASDPSAATKGKPLPAPINATNAPKSKPKKKMMKCHPGFDGGCENDGQCVAEECVCKPGWTGEDCTNRAAAKPANSTANSTAKVAVKVASNATNTKSTDNEFGDDIPDERSHKSPSERVLDGDPEATASRQLFL